MLFGYRFKCKKCGIKSLDSEQFKRVKNTDDIYCIDCYPDETKLKSLTKEKQNDQ